MDDQQRQPYAFSFETGDGQNKKLLGGKGANLCEMTQIGLNVPPGFVVTTQACLDFLENDQLPEGLADEINAQLTALEEKTGKGFGDPNSPLLLSVRSGSALSMPGMMDTILNLGLNQETLQGLIQQTGDERFSYDAYRRFIQLFGKVALGVPDEAFDKPFEEIKRREGVKADVGLSAENLKEASERFLEAVREHTGRAFPEDVKEGLTLAVKAVFRSWMGKRAIDYRREFKITPDMANGTAVNIMTMVFGNMGNDCATGVGFTRNPGTGENLMYGEYLVNAQGEDVVAGIRTPKPVQDMATEWPDMYQQLEGLRNRLETHYREVQDFEYTIEKGTLYCLQTRNGKMNAVATVRTSVEMANDGLLSREEALLRVDPELLEQLLHPMLDPDHDGVHVAVGLPASPGAASGKCVFDADRAELLGNAGAKVILVREETKPEDIHGFFASQGILTSRGGKTSHAAVVARGMGKPCVAGAEGIEVNTENRQARVGDHVLIEGDVITIDGGNGKVYLGEIETVPPEFSDDLRTLLGWADEAARIKVLANTDTPDGAVTAADYGAMGIGLCRTERMFNAPDRLPLVVDMILANTTEERQAALDRLLPVQRQDFEGLFKAMGDRPVTIRLLDPPIHEFLPTERQLEQELAHLRQLRGTIEGMRDLVGATKLMGDPEKVAAAEKIPLPADGVELIDEAIAKKQLMLDKVRELFEINPMLGHRGVRLGITYPEIYAMQIQAVIEAAAICQSSGQHVKPEIMVPQVCTAQELMKVRELVAPLQQRVASETGTDVNFSFGTMIEVVRACMRAGQLAQVAEFFSFGTNDLTQAAFSFSREDAENKFLPFYNENRILQDNPFEVLDVKGVGRLIKTAVKDGRDQREGMKIGICGEQGGHPTTIAFCHEVGLSYVSCSGPRIPVARLAAANAKLRAEEAAAVKLRTEEAA